MTAQRLRVSGTPGPAIFLANKAATGAQFRCTGCTFSKTAWMVTDACGYQGTGLPVAVLTGGVVTRKSKDNGYPFGGAAFDGCVVETAAATVGSTALLGAPPLLHFEGGGMALQGLSGSLQVKECGNATAPCCTANVSGGGGQSIATTCLKSDDISSTVPLLRSTAVSGIHVDDEFCSGRLVDNKTLQLTACAKFLGSLANKSATLAAVSAHLPHDQRLTLSVDVFPWWVCPESSTCRSPYCGCLKITWNGCSKSVGDAAKQGFNMQLFSEPSAVMPFLRSCSAPTVATKTDDSALKPIAVLAWFAVLSTVSGQHVECDTESELRQNMDYVKEVVPMRWMNE